MTVRELNKKLSKIAPDANLDIIMYSPSTDGIIRKTFCINSVGFETTVYIDKDEINAYIEIGQ